MAQWISGMLSTSPSSSQSSWGTGRCCSVMSFVCLTAVAAHAQTRFAERGYGWSSGESLDQLSERVVATLLTIGATHTGERIVAVGHGGTVRAGLAAADDLDILTHRTLWTGPAENCGVYEVEVEDGSLRRPASR